MTLRHAPPVRPIATALTLALFAAACSLPPVQLETAAPLALRSTVLAADGTVLAHLTGQGDCNAEVLKAGLCGENRTALASTQIPQVVKDAIIAVEDARYWQHGALDTRGLLRALVTNVEQGHVAQGGSTITQQLAKLMYSDPNGRRTLKSKVHELRYAIALEDRYTKDEILTMYLNRAYFGALAYGVAAATETYFNKPISRIRIEEAALLAGLVKEPTQLDPFRNREKSKLRRDTVIGRMYAEHLITQEQAAKAAATPIRVLRAPASCRRDKMPYFVHFIEEQIKNDPTFGKTRQEREQRLNRGGLTIRTTIDPKIQGYAEAAVRAGVKTLASNPDAALVSIDPKTGQIRAMASTQDDFCKAPYDPTWQGTPGPIPGSTFKPFALGAALEQGISPESFYSGAQRNLKGRYGVLKEQKNDDERDYGSVTLRFGMQLSINAVYMRLGLDVGPDNIADFAHRAGVRSDLRCADNGRRLPSSCLSIALGQTNVSPLEMASAYATFANNGLYMQPHGIKIARDGTGRVITNDRTIKGKQTIDPNVAYAITDVLESVACCGTARPAQFGRPMAAKTGTSDGHKNVWLMGYTPDLATAVWVGHMSQTAGLGARAWGATVAAPIWRAFMSKALAGVPPHSFINPPGILDLRTKRNTTGTKCGTSPTATGAGTTCPRSEPSKLPNLAPEPTVTAHPKPGPTATTKPKPKPAPTTPKPSPVATTSTPPPDPPPDPSASPSPSPA